MNLKSPPVDIEGMRERMDIIRVKAWLWPEKLAEHERLALAMEYIACPSCGGCALPPKGA